MKIAMLHWGFPPVIGGVETHLAMLCPDLVRMGHDVSLLTGWVDERREEVRVNGVLVRRTPLMDLNWLNPARILAFKAEIAAEVRDFILDVRPDVIHAHNMHYFSPTHAEVLGAVKREFGIPLVLTAHNVWSDSLWEEMLAYKDQWDEIIAVSAYIKRELVLSGYPAERIKVIYHGIDVDKFSPAREADEDLFREMPALRGRRIIFHPARMSLAKGSHLAVQAMAEIATEFPDALLVMAGTEKTVDWGSYQQGEIATIRKMIEDLRLTERVAIRFLPWSEMPRMYRASEIVIYPSCFEEPFGLVMLEALASGRPLVVSRAGGMPEIVKNGLNGLVIPRGSADALAGACLLLLRNREYALKLANRGRERVMKYFTKEVMAKKTVAAYARVISLAKAAESRTIQAGHRPAS
ncbi:MAG: glycosyltransferase family 4 protein [Clostridia bacterium]|nr:glycosyltransferase family 4 protein [Clostridia bacterium]